MAREDRVIDIDNTKGLLARLREAAGAEIRVGIIGDTANEVVSEDGLTMAALGAVHEFGTDRAGKNHDITIPERSHLRATWDDRATIRGAARKLNELYARSSTARQIMLGTAIILADAVKDKINRGLEPENKPATEQRKGSSRPLIDSGRYRDSIQGQVVMK